MHPGIEAWGEALSVTSEVRDRSHYVALVGLELTDTVLPQLLKR